MKNIDLQPLRNAIRRHRMMDVWSASIAPLTDAQKKEKAVKHALEAKEAYLKMMRSSKNDGSDRYKDWALQKALGLRAKKGYTAQATGGKYWKGWGRK